jgi:uncharacterized glyoxalase superfamily protein PhnB
MPDILAIIVVLIAVGDKFGVSWMIIMPPGA